MFDLHRLRLLRELSTRGTIAATAAACSLTPSAVSQQLSTLEREVGAPLLVRDGRRVVLTEAARVLVAHTEEVLATLQRAAAAIAQLDGSLRGVLRLGSFPTAAGTLASAAIAACHRAHPELRVLLAEHETTDGLAALRSGHLDLTLVYEYTLLAGVADEGVELLPLLQEPLLAALPPTEGPADAIEGPVLLRELAGQRWIAPSSDASLRVALERACELAGFSPRIDYRSDDFTVILGLVQAGLGVSLVPAIAVEPMATPIRLREIGDLRLSRTVSAAVRAGSAEHPLIAAMLTELRSAAEVLRTAKTAAYHAG